MHIYNSTDCEYEEQFRGMVMKAFADNIKRLRLKKRLTQEQVAESAGINPKYLGEIERGLKSPTAVVVHKLSNALAVPICSILSSEGCPYGKGAMPRKVIKLMSGQQEQDVQKAVKILEILFE